MKNNQTFKEELWKSHSSLKLILTVIFIAALLVSNVITWRQIALPFWITMTWAIIIFPITYILSDVFSEVYGYRWSRITCYMGFTCNLVMSLTFMVVINMKAPEYFMNADAYSTVLWNTWRVLCASLLAYVVWDFVNDKVFQKMKTGMDNMIEKIKNDKNVKKYIFEENKGGHYSEVELRMAKGFKWIIENWNIFIIYNFISLLLHF